ncbi:hypothetical protein DEA8626_00531 [Defluviimonas aquaemixtae]|uniref:Uncharacterized protein n=1 Tax=Albidovulum aquaemixtae TaxID=1542388 RepID=A0A2R8B364_9RHOB|nr:hypothetical protein [Defluviimonas aquaemixtae]SPH17017.1 hypothetical protein DEA8626_00531 [Defluviimonas aquaemixtae]
MSKEKSRGNREAKKPKKEKAKTPAAATNPGKTDAAIAGKKPK